VGSRGRAAGGALSAGGTVRVVPDVPTFSVDDGFVYRVPEGLAAGIGTIVRVPLGGRRVRGWVVGVGEPDRSGLKELLGVSGDHPAFSRGLLDVVRWASLHYVAPLATVIPKTAPPNLPRGTPAPLEPLAGPLPGSGMPEVGRAAAEGRRVGAHLWIGAGPWASRIAGLAGPILAADRSVLVVAPTVAEASALAAQLRALLGERVRMGSSEATAADTTRAWVDVQAPGRLLVGTRETAFWPVAGLSLAVVLDDGRRGLKDKATPTTHARDVLWRRSGVERFSLVICGPVPTSEALGRGGVVVRERRRAWGLIDVVDRTEEPPGRGVVAGRTRAALRSVVNDGGRALVFTDRRVAAMRCVRCRDLRVCPACGARPDRGSECPRCGAEVGDCPSCGGRRFEALGAPVDRVRAELAGVLGSRRVGEAGDGMPVEVGTERDLPGLAPVDLAVVVDADGLLRAPHYRAVEDGLRLMARVVAAAGSGRGRRAIVQTADPGHPALEALRRGDPVALVEDEIAARAPLGFPPHGELVVVEVRNPPQDADAARRAAIGGRGAVLGPAGGGERTRWLVQGRDLRAARMALRGLVQDWRELGASVRVDADPIDL